jgi:hypothetical protein
MSHKTLHAGFHCVPFIIFPKSVFSETITKSDFGFPDRACLFAALKRHDKATN